MRERERERERERGRIIADMLSEYTFSMHEGLLFKHSQQQYHNYYDDGAAMLYHNMAAS